MQSKFSLGVPMSLRRVGGIAVVAAATLIMISCGQVYRPVVIPINITPPNSQNFHAVFAMNTNIQANPGTAMQIDVSGDSDIGQGNMGIHYVNGDLVGDGQIDPSHPEAVLYEHTASGLQLTAVEYIVTKDAWKGAQPPELAGHPFMLITAPNRFGLPDFYALHVWVWKDNPTGTYRPWNPDVHCPNA